MNLQEQFENQALILDQLTEVSIALSTERDYQKLLELILSRALMLARCDAGSLYILDTGASDEGDETKTLRFVAAENHSVDFSFREMELPLTKKSLAGFVATTGEALNIEDAYSIAKDAPYAFNRDFDEDTGYRTKSLLILPMNNHRGEITGVLQLINRKRDPSALLDSPETIEEQIIPFDESDSRLMWAVGSLAAVSIENNRLYENIERLFEGFVKASVTAIEQRDPTTSGHSLRVSRLTVSLAETLNKLTNGPYAGTRFSDEQLKEMRYAGLLHDFGKVGVREQVLVKANKLYPHELERIETRLETARLYMERDYLLKKMALLSEKTNGIAERMRELDEEFIRQKEKLESFRQTILTSNRPTVLPEGEFSALKEIAATTYTDRMGAKHPVLEPGEVGVLSLPKGSLSDTERREIESHVNHTYEFLRQIPWTPELKEIPRIALRHHEKLNGRGYPHGVGADEIPIQSQIMSIVDIYDALSAADRPYKKAVPTEKALDILRFEAKDGFLQSTLVEYFIEAKVYEVTAGMVHI